MKLGIYLEFRLFGILFLKIHFTVNKIYRELR